METHHGVLFKVEIQENLCRFSYLDNAIFQSSKVKLALIESICDFFHDDNSLFSNEHMKLHLRSGESRVKLRS